MRFHVSALCLAGLLLGSAAYADHNDRHKGSYGGSEVRSDFRGHDWDYRDGNYYTYAGERLFYRQVFYPDLPSEEYIASKLADIVQNQRTEIAHLDAFSDRARTVGFENITSVYDAMERDHQRLADMAADWLMDHGFPVPPPHAMPAAMNISAEQTVDHMLQMHVDSFNRSLSQLEGERSHTVRGMLLAAAAGTAKHINWLRALDRDVEFGRKTLSAFLRSQIDSTYLAENHAELLARIVEEEWTTLNIRTASEQAATVWIVDRPVEVEKEVIVERPVIQERIVEVPAPAPAPQVIIRERTLGQQEVVVPAPRVRARRPAK